MVEVYGGRATDRLALPLRMHNLLLALAGRLDDSGLSETRELAARARLDEAAELTAGILIAGRLPVRESEQRELALLLELSRSDATLADHLTVSADASAWEVEHRFSGDGEPDRGVSAALSRVLRVLPDLRSVHAVWRNTPAGAVGGVLPQRVVLVEVGPNGSPPATAHRVDTALRRAGIRASVEVLGASEVHSGYHQAARSAAVLVWQSGADGGKALQARTEAPVEWQEPTEPTALQQPEPTEPAEPAASPEPEPRYETSTHYEPASAHYARAANAEPTTTEANPESEPAAEPEVAAEPEFTPAYEFDAPAYPTESELTPDQAATDQTPAEPEPVAESGREPVARTAESTAVFEPEHPVPEFERSARPEPQYDQEQFDQTEPEQVADGPDTSAGRTGQQTVVTQAPETTDWSAPGELFQPLADPPEAAPSEGTSRAEHTADLSSEVAKVRASMAAKDSTSGELDGGDPKADGGLDDPRLSDRDRALLRELHAELAKREREETTKVRLNGRERGDEQPPWARYGNG